MAESEPEWRHGVAVWVVPSSSGSGSCSPCSCSDSDDDGGWGDGAAADDGWVACPHCWKTLPGGALLELHERHCAEGSGLTARPCRVCDADVATCVLPLHEAQCAADREAAEALARTVGAHGAHRGPLPPGGPVPYAPVDRGPHTALSDRLLRGPVVAVPIPPWAWEPDTDAVRLFRYFDEHLFASSLASVPVLWSRRMTLAAGQCEFRGLAGGCTIKLSEPLLKFRSRDDLFTTLIHEMIHAFLFLDANVSNREAHGDIFHAHMRRVNAATGLRVTVYHSFMDEVNHYRTHWWKCQGRCGRIIRRSMNRAPGRYDGDSWTRHQARCGGPFLKIREPPEYTAKRAAKRKRAADRAAAAAAAARDAKRARSFFSLPPEPSPDAGAEPPDPEPDASP